MGLDITAYSKITRCTECESFDDSDSKWSSKEVVKHRWLSVLPERTRVADGLETACYIVDDEYGFRAGSYGGYNLWRDLLSRAFLGVPARDVWRNPGAYDSPITSLINFSDCEGLIGPVTSASLHRALVDGRELYLRFMTAEKREETRALD